MGFIKKILKYTIIGFILLVIVALIIPEEWLETDEENVTSVQADNEEDKVEAMIKYFEINHPTKPISEMDDVEYLEMVFDPMIMKASFAASEINDAYLEVTYRQGLKYNEAKEGLEKGIEYLDNLAYNVEQIPTNQFSNKVKKRADNFKEALAEYIYKEKKLFETTKKLMKDDKYTSHELGVKVKEKGGEDLNEFFDKKLKKANDKFYDLVYDR